MSPCTCPESSLTSVTFASGAVLLRCGSHEAQTWLVDGRTAPTSAALRNLRALFDDRRGARTAAVRTPRPAPRATAPLPTAELADAYPAEPTSDALTALLRERGFTGSWAVA